MLARTCKWALVGLVLTLGGASAAGFSSDLAGAELWVYRLVWTPQYCRQNQSSTEPQCTNPHYFLPQALQPEASLGNKNCPKVKLLRDQLDRLLPIVQNEREISKNWLRDGGCTGLDFEEFANRLDYASRKVSIPATYWRLEERKETSAQELRSEFVKANPGLGDAGIALACDGRELVGVRICLTSDMEFRDCVKPLPNNCGNNVMVRGSRIGRMSR